MKNITADIVGIIMIVVGLNLIVFTLPISQLEKQISECRKNAIFTLPILPPALSQEKISEIRNKYQMKDGEMACDQWVCFTHGTGGQAFVIYSGGAGGYGDTNHKTDDIDSVDIGAKLSMAINNQSLTSSSGSGTGMSHANITCGNEKTKPDANGYCHIDQTADIKTPGTRPGGK